MKIQKSFYLNTFRNKDCRKSTVLNLNKQLELLIKSK